MNKLKIQLIFMISKLIAIDDSRYIKRMLDQM